MDARPTRTTGDSSQSSSQSRDSHTPDMTDPSSAHLPCTPQSAISMLSAVAQLTQNRHSLSEVRQFLVVHGYPGLAHMQVYRFSAQTLSRQPGGITHTEFHVIATPRVAAALHALYMSAANAAHLSAITWFALTDPQEIASIPDDGMLLHLYHDLHLRPDDETMSPVRETARLADTGWIDQRADRFDVYRYMRGLPSRFGRVLIYPHMWPLQVLDELYLWSRMPHHMMYYDHEIRQGIPDLVPQMAPLRLADSPVLYVTDLDDLRAVEGPLYGFTDGRWTSAHGHEVRRSDHFTPFVTLREAMSTPQALTGGERGTGPTPTDSSRAHVQSESSRTTPSAVPAPSVTQFTPPSRPTPPSTYAEALKVPPPIFSSTPAPPAPPAQTRSATVVGAAPTAVPTSADPMGLLTGVVTPLGSGEDSSRVAPYEPTPGGVESSIESLMQLLSAPHIVGQVPSTLPPSSSTASTQTYAQMSQPPAPVMAPLPAATYPYPEYISQYPYIRYPPEISAQDQMQQYMLQQLLQQQRLTQQLSQWIVEMQRTQEETWRQQLQRHEMLSQQLMHRLPMPSDSEALRDSSHTTPQETPTRPTPTVAHPQETQRGMASDTSPPTEWLLRLYLRGRTSIREFYISTSQEELREVVDFWRSYPPLDEAIERMGLGDDSALVARFSRIRGPQDRAHREGYTPQSARAFMKARTPLTHFGCSERDRIHFPPLGEHIPSSSGQRDSDSEKEDSAKIPHVDQSEPNPFTERVDCTQLTIQEEASCWTEHLEERKVRQSMPADVVERPEPITYVQRIGQRVMSLPSSVKEIRPTYRIVRRWVTQPPACLSLETCGPCDRCQCTQVPTRTGLAQWGGWDEHGIYQTDRPATMMRLCATCASFPAHHEAAEMIYDHFTQTYSPRDPLDRKPHMTLIPIQQSSKKKKKSRKNKKRGSDDDPSDSSSSSSSDRKNSEDGNTSGGGSGGGDAPKKTPGDSDDENEDEYEPDAPLIRGGITKDSLEMIKAQTTMRQAVETRVAKMEKFTPTPGKLEPFRKFADQVELIFKDATIKSYFNNFLYRRSRVLDLIVEQKVADGTMKDDIIASRDDRKWFQQNYASHRKFIHYIRTSLITTQDLEDEEARFRKSSQRPEESAHDWADRLNNHFVNARLNPRSSAKYGQLVEYYIKGLRQPLGSKVKKSMRSKRPKPVKWENLKEKQAKKNWHFIRQLVLRKEREHLQEQQQNTTSSARTRGVNSFTRGYSRRLRSTSTTRDTVAQATERIAPPVGERGPHTTARRPPPRSPRRPTGRRDLSHRRPWDPQRRGLPSKPHSATLFVSKGDQTVDSTTVVCWNCGKPGHIARRCPQQALRMIRDTTGDPGDHLHMAFEDFDMILAAQGFCSTGLSAGQIESMEHLEAAVRETDVSMDEGHTTESGADSQREEYSDLSAVPSVQTDATESDSDYP